jgi:glycosyltransferase involved in cell wall biosynthesis
MKINFFTIVYNGMPFIEHHIEEFKSTGIDWHWHIVEGLAELSHDTAWSLSTGGEITVEQRSTNLSKDGTTEYIDTLKNEYPNSVTVYRKDKGQLWDGKIEMVNAPLANIKEECLLWQIDCDEHWNFHQIRNVHKKFTKHKEKTAAWFWCNYHVGIDSTISTRNCYAQNPNQEWLRVWKFRPGDEWSAHEPPILNGVRNGNRVDIGRQNPFMHDEMESIGAVFEHYAYILPKQLMFKETYYGYKGALKKWENLQLALESQDVVKLGDYFHWVKDGTLAKKNKRTKILFVDHEYHKVTKSSEFFIDIISSVGNVKVVWDKSHESTDSKFDIDTIRALQPDIIIIWQSEKAALACAESDYSDVYFIPMHDSAMHVCDDFWKKIAKCKVINFSLKTYNTCRINNIKSIYVQYFKKPEPANNIYLDRSKTAFFWQRRKIPNIDTIRPFLKSLGVSKLLYHNVPDPGVIVKRSPSILDRIKYSIDETKWFDSANNLKLHIKKAGVYFAPRLEEGIGMSFLEGLANGQCVVAPDGGTMNEYITNGVNGILYNESTESYKVPDLDQIQSNAIRAATNGDKRWKDGINDILRFLNAGNPANPSRRIFKRLSLTKRSVSLLPCPKITVCVVVKNAESQIKNTIESVLLQDYPNLEIIVKNGCSSDGTLKILEKYSGSIDIINSSEDSGIYDGMNQAALLATGEWVIYMNAGDSFFSKRSVSNAFRGLNISSDCALIIGNNLLINNLDNSIDLEKSFYLEDTLLKVKNAIYHNALNYYPCHQSVFTRRDLLVKYKFNCSFARAADHDFYLRVINDGYTSHHTGELISNYLGGGFSAANELKLFEEWESIDLKYSQNREITKKYYSDMRANASFKLASMNHIQIKNNIHKYYQNTISWKITKPVRIITKFAYYILQKKYNDLDNISIKSLK